VNEALLISGVKIAGSVALLAAVLWGVSRLSRIARLDPEVGRKLVHISLGLYCLAFPLVFEHAWEVAITCALALGIFMLARGMMRQSLGAGLHGVERTSYGELLFAVSVALLFWLKDGHFIAVAVQGKPPPMGSVLYIVPILILTLCDAASAVVGSRYGKRLFRIEEGSKSVEGVVVFAVTAWLMSLIAFLLLTPNIGRGEVILLAFITAAFGALLEAASWRGLDNLFIPLGLYFLLANLLHLGVFELAVRAGIFFLALLAIIWLTPRSRADRHAVAAGFTLFFCIAIFSGFDSILTPAVAVAMYFGCVQWLKIERPPHDNLNLLLVVLAVALGFFIVSNLGRIDTIFGFNVAFAALAAGIVARFTSNGLVVVGALVLAWLAMSVRTLWVAGPREETWVFGLLGLGGILALAVAGSILRERKIDRPWMMLGGLSMGIGLVSLPASPT
jgi:dolichol kinase